MALAADPSTIDGVGFGTKEVAFGDVNGDGFDDAIALDTGTQIDIANRGFLRIDLYLGSASGLEETPSWSHEQPELRNVAGILDVDGDGYNDVVVSGMRHQNVYAFRGGPGGLTTLTQELTLPANAYQYGTANSVLVPDLDGDGHPDLVLPLGEESTGAFAGALMVIPGGPTGLDLGAATTWTTPVDTGNFETRLRTADFDGDGLSDVQVRSIVAYGGPAGLTVTAIEAGGDYVPVPDIDGDGDDELFSLQSLEILPGDPLGIDVGYNLAASPLLDPPPLGTVEEVQAAMAVDVDADGSLEMLLGWKLTQGEPDEGATAMYAAAPGGFVATPTWWAEGNDTSENLAPRGVSDTDGDGYPEVWLGPADVFGTSRAYYLRRYPCDVDGLPLAFPVGDAIDAEGGPYAFGTTVGAADLDGDGFTDVLVSAPFPGVPAFPSGLAPDGELWIYRGGPAGLDRTPTVIEVDSGRFGRWISNLGDVDGDGTEDVVIGASDLRAEESVVDPNYAEDYYDYYGTYPIQWGLAVWSDEVLESGFSVFLGAPDLSTMARQDVVDTSGVPMGLSATRAGDIDGDGDVEIVVRDTPSSIAVYAPDPYGVYPAVPTWTHRTRRVHPLGDVLADLGDVNGDGYDDIVFAGHFDPGTFSLSEQDTDGHVMVYYGSASGLQEPPQRIDPPVLDSYFGVTADGPGDVNGDGYDDLWVTTQKDSAYLYLGGPSGLAGTPAWRIPDLTVETWGYEAVGAGDIDADGYADTLIRPVNTLGVGQLTHFGNDEPYRLLFGGPTGPDESNAWALDAHWGSGLTMAGAGDVDGDGYGDLVFTGNETVLMVYGWDILGLSPPVLADTGATGDTGTVEDTGPTTTPSTTPTVPSTTDTTEEPSTADKEAGDGGGCGCQTGGPAGGLLGVVAALMWRRRR